MNALDTTSQWLFCCDGVDLIKMSLQSIIVHVTSMVNDYQVNPAISHQSQMIFRVGGTFETKFMITVSETDALIFSLRPPNCPNCFLITSLIKSWILQKDIYNHSLLCVKSVVRTVDFPFKCQFCLIVLFVYSYFSL